MVNSKKENTLNMVNSKRLWRIGTYVPTDKVLYVYRTGSNIGNVLVAEAVEGTGSVAIVGHDGKILAWIMRHEPVEFALAFMKENEQIVGYDRDFGSGVYKVTEEDKHDN